MDALGSRFVSSSTKALSNCRKVYERESPNLPSVSRVFEVTYMCLLPVAVPKIEAQTDYLAKFPPKTVSK